MQANFRRAVQIPFCSPNIGFPLFHLAACHFSFLFYSSISLPSQNFLRASAERRIFTMPRADSESANSTLLSRKYFPSCRLPFFICHCQNCRLEFRHQAAVWSSRLEFRHQAAVLTKTA